MSEEIWKQYDDYIEVSTMGRVRSIDTKHYYKPNDNGEGYYSIWIKRQSKGIITYELREYIHRLVAKTFIPNPYNKTRVNHKDFNRSNNTLENLEWVTDSENMQWNLKHNRLNVEKANEDTRQPIVVYDKINNTEMTFKDIKSASLYYGYNKHRFSHILNRHNGETSRFKITRLKEKRQYA